MALRRFRYIGTTDVDLSSVGWGTVHPNQFFGPVEDSLPVVATLLTKNQLMEDFVDPSSSGVSNVQFVDSTGNAVSL